MLEVYLIVTGLVFFIWLYALIRQALRGVGAEADSPARPVVPLSLRESSEAVLVAEGRGRIVYANESARNWFGLNGGVPDLNLMAQRVQPADSLHDLLAGAGQASFRLGQRQIEAVSHAIPTAQGLRIVVVMRELTADALVAYTDYDPLRALAIISQISERTGQQPELSTAVETVIEALGPAVRFDAAEVTLWHPETETLRPVARSMVRTPDGRLLPPEDISGVSYRVGEGYSGWIALYRQPLLINNVSGRSDVLPKRFDLNFESYLGVPLQIGHDLIGTLELTHTERNAFTQRDAALLQAVSGQVAATLYAARLYGQQTARIAELDGLQQISEAMSQLADPYELFGQLTQRIAALMRVDLCGVLIFDEEAGVFRSRVPFYGAPDSLVQDYRLALAPGSELDTIWQHQPYWFTNDPEAPVIRAMGFDDLRSAITINQLALAPMLVGARRIGLLLAINKQGPGGFRDDDLRLLLTYAAQAAIVAENARLYSDEQRRARELGGLQQIAQAMGLVRTPAELIGQITRRVADLMNVELCGILLYDPQTRVLASQAPFFGLEDPEAVRFYQLPSPPGSRLLRLWHGRDMWYSNAIQRDPLAADTDLALLAQQIGVHKTAIATLRVGDTRLGILQAANKRDLSDFSEDDARILSIFAGQAAVLIDNARLYREMQRRTHEAEGLRAITEIVSASVPGMETIEQVLIAIANVLEADVVTIGLVDEATGHLVVAPGYAWGVRHVDPYSIDAYASGFETSTLVSRRPLISADLRTDERILPPYRALIDKLGLRTWVQVPLIVQNRSIGELTVANKAGGEFTELDAELLMAMGTQVAALLERMRFHRETDQDLRQRVAELNALNRVSHELGQTLELDRILDVIRQEALRSTQAGAASIVLIKDHEDWEDPQQPEIERRFGEGRALRSLAPIELAALQRNDVLNVPDYADSEFEARPATARSALAVPITFGEQAVGVLHLYSGEPDGFDRRSVDFALALTDQATVALVNSRRYQDQLALNQRMRARTEQMARIFALGELFREGATLEQTLEEVAHSIQETVGFNVVLISLVDEETGVLRRTAQAGMPLAIFEELKQTSPALEQARGLMQERFRISNSYFLPAEGSEGLTDGLPIVQLLQERLGHGPRAWDPDDLLLVPLRGSQGQLLGLFSVDEPQSGRRPDIHTIEALEIFANQAAFSVENYRLLERIRREAESTRRERDSLAQLHLVAGRIQSAEDVPARLQVVADGIREAGWRRVVITLRDEHLDPIAVISSGYAPEEAEAVTREIESGETWRGWINDLDFHARKLGAGYYLRYNDPWVLVHRLKDRAIEPPTVGEREWHPQDVLYMPLVGQESQRIIGMIAMQGPLDGRVPEEAALQPFELFASQAAAAIETTQLYQQTIRAAQQEQRINDIMEAVSAAIRPADAVAAIGRGLRQMVPFTHFSVALAREGDTPFATLEAEIAPDGTVAVHEGAPVPREGTALSQVYRMGRAQSYALQRDSVSRETLADLSAWYADGERSTVIVPMVAAGKVIGALHLGSRVEDAFTFAEIGGLVQRLANLSAVALENARLFEQARERAAVLDVQAQRLASLNNASARLAASLDPQEIYQIVLTTLQDALGVDYGGLMLIDEPEAISRLVISTHPLDDPLPNFTLPLAGNPLVEAMQQLRQPVVAEDLQTDPRFEATRPVHEARNTRAMMIVPVILGERLVATIGLDSATPRRFTEQEIDLAMTAANQTAVALEKARLFAEAEARAAELNAQAQRMARVNHVSALLAQTLDLQEIYRIVLTELQEALGMAFGGVALIQEDGKVAHLAYDTHPDAPPPGTITIPVKSNRAAATVLKTRKTLVCSDVLTDPAFAPSRKTLRARGTRAMIVAPLIVADEVIGTIGLDATEVREFSEAEIELMETIASQASLAIEKARLYHETLGLTIFNQAVVEAIQQGIVVLDQDLKILRINRFMVERYGWGGEAVGRALFDYRPDYQHFLRESISTGLALGEPQMLYEVERRDDAGKPSIRNYYLYPMREAAQVTGIVLLVEDVSERARLEADLQARAVQTAALTEVSGEFTATLDPDQVIALILDALGRVIPYDGVALWLRVPDREELKIAAARGYADPDAPALAELIGLTVEIPFSPLFREMSANTKVINVGDVAGGDPRFPYGSAAIYKNWMGAPLVSRGEVVGVMALEKRERHFYTTLHEQLALTFANQAAVALINAQLFSETRMRAQELDEQAQRLALLNRVSLALAQTLDLENIFEIALREAAIALDIKEGAALQIEPTTGLASAVVEYPRGDAPPDLTLNCARNVLLDRVRTNLIPVVVERRPDDPQAEALTAMLRRADVVRTLMVPLVVGGDVIGALRLDALDEGHEFTSEQVGLAQTIASQAAIAVQNAALFEQTATRTSELETLFESAQATAVTLDLDEVVRRVTVQMLAALTMDACTVFLWDDVNDQLVVRGEISARAGEAGALQVGDAIAVASYPLRERALRERALLIARADDPELPAAELELMRRHQIASRMLIPLIVNEIAIGLIEVESLDPERYFKPENVRLARTLASQAAISIENARLQTETRRTVEELYIINDMSSALSSAKSLEQLLEVIELQLPNLTDAHWIYVALYDAAHQQLSFPLALSVVDDARLALEPHPLGHDELSVIIRQKAPLLLAGEHVKAARSGLGIQTMMPGARCFLGVPLLVGDEVIGALAVRDDRDPLAFTHNDQRVLTTVGGQLSVAIQSTRLLQQTLELAEDLDRRVQQRTAELEQERQQLSTLYGITTELATSLEMQRLLERALEMVARAVGATQGAILALEPATERLVFRAQFGWELPAGADGGETSLTTDQGLAGWAIQNRRSVIVDDVQQDPRWLRLTEADDRPRAAMVALIETNEDVLGVILLTSEAPAQFHEEQLRLVIASAHQVANAMNNAELYSLIRDQAERLGEMLRQEQVAATQSGAILDSVVDGVMVVNAEGRVIVFNAAAGRILRVPVETVLNKALSDVAGARGGRVEWLRKVGEWMGDPGAYERGEFHEEQLTLDDGRVINVRLSPVSMGDQYLGMVSVLRDITREVEVDRLKSEFVATVSHELRTPMTSIKGYADLLLLGAAGKITEQQQSFLETIKQNADRLGTLVNDLLDISRIDQGRVDLKPARVEVIDLIEEAAQHLRQRCQDEGRPLSVWTDLPKGEPPVVWGDYDKLVQVLQNLSDNAFNYTPVGGTITLGAALDAGGERVVLRVADTGIGIPPEVADRVFERFFRGDEVQDVVMDTPGTGLGLSIVSELVKVHRGEVWFESEPGRGTIFYVSLPTQPWAPETADDSARASKPA